MRIIDRRFIVAVLALGFIVAGSLLARSGSSGVMAGATATRKPASIVSATAAPMPACAKAGTAVPLPAGFPSSFPLPPGSVITGKDTPVNGVTVKVITPMNAHDVAQYLESQLRANNFISANWDAEAGESESAWAGADYIGRWKARDIPGCPGSATLAVFAGK